MRGCGGYGFELKKSEKGYTITSATLIKANGKPVTSAFYEEACSPAEYQGSGFPQEARSGNGVICGLSVNLPPNVKSIVIDVTTNKCLPANAITGIKGPKGGCKK